MNQSQAQKEGLVLMRLSGYCISCNPSSCTTIQALIPTADDESNTSQLSCALVTLDLLSMRNTPPGSGQQIESVDMVFALTNGFAPMQM